MVGGFADTRILAWQKVFLRHLEELFLRPILTG
jgi:hypothetical protein